MTCLPTVLFFTLPEYGQANVVLATSYELALAGASIYVASFAPLEPRVTHLQELVARHHDASCPSDRPTGSVSFCECKGFSSFMEVAKRNGLDIATFPHPPGVCGVLKSFSVVDIFYFPWTPKEHLIAIERIKEIITTVKPDVVVIDTLFYLAMDACQLMGQAYTIILPNSIKDIALGLQPHMEALWKYPTLSSGFPFPLKWWQIPLNIYIFVWLVIRILSCPRVRQVRALRRSLGIKPPAALQFHPGVKHVCPALPETDFPLSFIPEEMVLCGPIVLPFDPLEEVDPELLTWLDKGPTVMVNLGSHAFSDKTSGTEMASALRVLLDYHDRRGTGRFQVLWKIKSNGDIQRAIGDMIEKESKEGRIKVVPWLNAEPVSILQHPNVVCTVHHGGANSFFEGIWSGKPHVILPVWLDTYEYAARAEFLNVGLFGSKRSAPGVRADELGEALMRVTGYSEEARTFRLAAERLKLVCRTKGEGRKLAAVAILKEFDISM